MRKWVPIAKPWQPANSEFPTGPITRELLQECVETFSEPIPAVRDFHGLHEPGGKPNIPIGWLHAVEMRGDMLWGDLELNGDGEHELVGHPWGTAAIRLPETTLYRDGKITDGRMKARLIWVSLTNAPLMRDLPKITDV